MRRMPIVAAMLLAAGLSACATTQPQPVEVDRFFTPALASMSRGAVELLPAPGNDGTSNEFRDYAAAVSDALGRAGYPSGPGGSAVVVVDVQRQVMRAARGRPPVSVGAGASNEGWHSGAGVGLGVSFNLGGGPKDQLETRLAVTIRDRASGAALWEGRARYVAAAKSPGADEPAIAAKMAHALFGGFPGTSGETILVK